ncbi:hypothetical protein PM082_020592 [Marasmius tenuissimus]|nr:hypothetical protein PM082_020592 [Marasmius tenuissimus]
MVGHRLWGEEYVKTKRKRRALVRRSCLKEGCMTGIAEHGHATLRNLSTPHIIKSPENVLREHGRNHEHNKASGGRVKSLCKLLVKWIGDVVPKAHWRMYREEEELVL